MGTVQPLVLTVLGLVLETAAFVVAYADRFPRIRRLLSPRHARAMAGLGRIIDTGELSQSDTGLRELSDLILRDVARTAPEVPLGDRSIRAIRRAEGGMVEMYATQAGMQASSWVDVELSDGSKGRVDFELLKLRVGTLRSAGLFRVAVVVFLAGVALQVWALCAGGCGRTAALSN